MKFFLPLLIVSLLAASAEAQNRRDRTSRDRGSDRSSVGGSSGTPISDDNTDKSNFDHYKLLSDHNIFTKNRHPPSTQRSRDPRFDRPASKPEVAFVLTGCVIEDDNRYAAFVENAQTGVTLKVGVGDSIATGKVTAIGFNFLEYETGGQKTQVEIGHNFTGSVASLAEVIAAPTTGPTTGPVDLTNLSLEERLKRKRLLELSGGK